jgi:LmbE family N-acetylglucosaminyl deacetylase
MQWIYISPHLDDVALSCGGLVWEQAQAGDPVSIWSICAGDPPEGSLSNFARSLHARWGTDREAIAKRREEDINSCEKLGAAYRHFDIPDCIYRRTATSSESHPKHLYTTEESLFGPIHPADTALIETLGDEISKTIPPESEIVCPLSLGNHVDHCLVRASVERTRRDLWYYADYPYVLQNSLVLEELAEANWERVLWVVSPEGLSAWKESIAAHQSQISTFWPDLEAMRTDIDTYLGRNEGIVLWRSL